jgi:hypothetical protein
MVALSSKRSASLAFARLSLGEIQSVQPEWVRLPIASRVSGLSRTFLFERILDGTIVSKHLKRPGKSKGIRLINYRSLMAFIEGLEG